MLEEIVIDSFAGGGGTSEGIVEAIGRDPDIAINHDKYALAMHRVNHPGTEHLVEDVVTLDAVSMCNGRPVGFLWMSPDCKDHSKAKGGKPRDKNIRGLAWAVFGWVKALPKWQRPRLVFLENVEEFEDWSPLLQNGKRCPVQKGTIFKQFISSWRDLGYTKIEWRIRRAWKSGAGTIRKRLYVIMRRDDEPIIWPEPTHGNPNDPVDAGMIARGLLRPWVTAADSIDFSLVCPSIFDTAAEIKEKYGLRAIRPLQPSTMGRVAKGTWRYVVTSAKPFIVPVTHKGDFRSNSVDEPWRTITSAKRGEHALITPFITKFQTGSTGHPATEPLHTITAHASDTHGGGAAPLGIVAPILVGCGGCASQTEPRSASEPVITQTGKPDLCVAAVHLSTMRNAQKPFNEIDKPRHTDTAGGANAAVIAAFLAQHNTGMVGHSATKPVSTIVEKGSTQALVQAELVAACMLTLRGSDRRDARADVPLNTLSAQGTHAAAVYAFLSKYYGAGQPSQPVDEPLHTDTAKPRFGLSDAHALMPPLTEAQIARARQVADFLRSYGYWDDREFVTVGDRIIVDIGMRMLTPRERFNAQGFRRDYIIDHGLIEDGSIIKFTAEQQGYMCGNSVCPTEAAALICANYRPRRIRRPRRGYEKAAPLLEVAE